MRVYIIHGSEGYPEKHWFPWLRAELEKRGCEVRVPRFPLEEKQTLQDWFSTIEPEKDDLNDSIVICHSMGCSFILNCITKWGIKPKHLFLVAGFVNHLDYELDLDDFSVREFDWELIHTIPRTVIASYTDPHVPKEKTDEFAKKCNVTPIIIEGGGHFSGSQGYTEFHELLDLVKKIE